MSPVLIVACTILLIGLFLASRFLIGSSEHKHRGFVMIFYFLFVYLLGTVKLYELIKNPQSRTGFNVFMIVALYAIPLLAYAWHELEGRNNEREIERPDSLHNRTKASAKIHFDKLRSKNKDN